MTTYSLNKRFILEPYKGERSLKATQNGAGFAMIAQKVNLVGLKLLVDVLLDQKRGLSVGEISSTEPIVVPKGTTVYVKEELLYTQEWAKKLYECPKIEGKFMIVDQQYVEFVSYE